MAADYPHPTTPAVTAVMRGNRRCDTQPEIRLRSALHARGLRFRKDYPIEVPGVRVRADIAFPRQRVAVFLDGCFWHACPEHGTQPRSNDRYWAPKLRRNQERDLRVNDGLVAAGWTVVRAWEHQPIDEVAAEVESVTSAARALPRSPAGPPRRQDVTMADQSELGGVAWRARPEVPDASESVGISRRLLATISLSVLFEDHPGYGLLHAIVRLSGFAAEMYEESRGAIDIGVDDPSQLVFASTRLEYAVITLHKAMDHAEVLRRHGGQWPGFGLRRNAPATRGARPFAIDKIEKRGIGDFDRIRDFRNALEHADERLARGEAGNTLLVPRQFGISFDQADLRYDEFVSTASRLLAIAATILDAGGADVNAEDS